eukprot:491189-Karenia_brevis.AAC.1
MAQAGGWHNKGLARLRAERCYNLYFDRHDARNVLKQEFPEMSRSNRSEILSAVYGRVYVRHSTNNGAQATRRSIGMQMLTTTAPQSP